jgi:hypothetical protein
MKIRVLFIFWLLLGAIAAGSDDARAADADQLFAAYQTMETAKPSSDQVYFVRDFALQRHDFTLRLDSANLYFFPPITLDDSAHYWGAWIEGRGLFQFAPGNSIERNQLALYMSTDSLNRRFYNGIVLFDDSLAKVILASGKKLSGAVPAWDTKAYEEMFRYLTYNQNRWFFFETLRNSSASLRRPFLTALVHPENTDHLIYMFDPYLREEVQFFKDYTEFVISLFMENICSYSVYADDSRIRINGVRRDRIKPVHYDINAAIDAKGRMIGNCRLTFTTQLSPSQMLLMHLHQELLVDSIMSADSHKLPFLRYTTWDDKSDSLYVFLEQANNKGDTSELTFYYHGELVPAGAPVFMLQGDDAWYPVYRRGQEATFSLSYAFPKTFPFYSSGNLASDSSDALTRYARWEVAHPSPQASFTIGEYEQYQFATEVAPIEIFVSETLHREKRLEYSGDMRFGDRHIERQVADDVSQALKLFNHNFGEYGRDRLVITESLLPRAGNTPGIVNLNWESVFFADLWGDNRLNRADAVARQWWGAGVKFDSYRDSWLSDGFAAYSALLYVQAAEGNDRFLYWLAEHQKEILSLDKLVGNKNHHMPSLALGYRSSGTESRLITDSLKGDFEGFVRDQRTQTLQRGEFDLREVRDDDTVGQGLARSRNISTFDPFSKDHLIQERPRLTDTTQTGYYRIVKLRGAFVLHMLRNMLMDLQTLDDSKFYTMMRDFYLTYNGKMASTNDFRMITEKYTGMDMGWFFDQWVFGSAIPTYEFKYKIEDEKDDTGRWRASVDIKQSDVPEGFRMFVPIDIQFAGDKHLYMRLLVDQPNLTIQLPTMDLKPKKIVLNPFHSVLARVKQ